MRYQATAKNESGATVNVGPRLKYIQPAVNALIAHEVDGEVINVETGTVMMLVTWVDGHPRTTKLGPESEHVEFDNPFSHMRPTTRQRRGKAVGW